MALFSDSQSIERKKVKVRWMHVPLMQSDQGRASAWTANIICAHCVGLDRLESARARFRGTEGAAETKREPYEEEEQKNMCRTSLHISNMQSRNINTTQ